MYKVCAYICSSRNLRFRGRVFLREFLVNVRDFQCFATIIDTMSARTTMIPRLSGFLGMQFLQLSAKSMIFSVLGHFSTCKCFLQYLTSAILPAIFIVPLAIFPRYFNDFPASYWGGGGGSYMYMYSTSYNHIY